MFFFETSQDITLHVEPYIFTKIRLKKGSLKYIQRRHQDLSESFEHAEILLMDKILHHQGWWLSRIIPLFIGF